MIREELKQQGTQAVPLLVELAAFADETMKSWKGTIPEWLIAKTDKDTMYFVKDEEGNPAAIFWGNEKLHEVATFNAAINTLKGTLTASKGTVYYKYVGEDIRNNITVTPGENGTFEHTFDKALDMLDLSTSNFKTIEQLPYTRYMRDMSKLFNNVMSITSLDLSSFNTENVTNMSGMFDNCRALTSLDLSSFNTEKVTNMSNMFNNCLALNYLDISSFNTENVTDMSYMMCGIFTSLDVSLFNTEKVMNMRAMFAGCDKLTSLDLSSFNTENVTKMTNMFSNCKSLTSLDLSSFNTEKVIDMQCMFSKCFRLTSLDIRSFNTENVTNMYMMFMSVSDLTSLDLSSFNTEKVEYMGMMFYNCPALTTINLGSFNTEKVIDIDGAFLECYALTNTTGIVSNLKLSISFENSPLLTPESCMVFINGLSEEVSDKTITFHADAYDRLIPEQIAVATSKGWSVVRA